MIQMIKLVLVATLLSIAAAAQVSVSATVTDPNGIPYASGSVTISVSTAVQLNGSPYTPPPVFGIDQYGKFSVSLADNNILQPSGSTYSFNVCSSPSGIVPPFSRTPTCFTASKIKVTGAVVNLSSAISNQAASIGITPAVPSVNRWNLSFNCGTAPNCTSIFADGQSVVDATSNSTTTVTCPNSDCNFTGTDIYGRPIMKVGQKIWAATSSNLSFSSFVCPVTTVASFAAQSVVLNSACTANGTANVALYWGDDDGPTLHSLTLQCVNYQVPAGVNIITSRGFMDTKPACSNTGLAAGLNFPFPGLSAAAGNNSAFWLSPDFNFTDCTGSNGQVTNICIGGALGQIEKLFFYGTGIETSNLAAPPAGNANCSGITSATYILAPGTQGGVVHNVVLAGICPGQSNLVGVEVFGADGIFDDGGAIDVGAIGCQSDGPNNYFSSNDCTDVDTGGIGLNVNSGSLNDFNSYQYVVTSVASGATLNGHGTRFNSENAQFALTLATGAITTHDGDTFICNVANTGCIKASGTARVSLRNAAFTGASTNSALNWNTGATLIDQGGNTVSGAGQVLFAQTSTPSSVMGNQVITGVCQGTASAASTLGLFGAGEIATPNCTSTTVNIGVPMTRAGTLMGLGVTASAGGVNSSSGVVTVMKTTAGSTSATTLTCTLGTAAFCEDSVHTVSYAIGDVISIQFTTQSAETLANVKANVLAW